MTRMPERLLRLIAGLFLYGFTMAMMVESTLGLDPWDVFHQGLAAHLPLTFGQVVIIVGAVVLLLWIPLRQMPGIGTVLNVIVIGFAADFGIAMIDQPHDLVLRGLLLVGGVRRSQAGSGSTHPPKCALPAHDDRGCRSRHRFHPRRHSGRGHCSLCRVDRPDRAVLPAPRERRALRQIA